MVPGRKDSASRAENQTRGSRSAFVGASLSEYRGAGTGGGPLSEYRGAIVGEPGSLPFGGRAAVSDRSAVGLRTVVDVPPFHGRMLSICRCPTVGPGSRRRGLLSDFPGRGVAQPAAKHYLRGMESLDRAPEEGRTFHIRNMVCDRCILVVRDLFTRLGLEPECVELGYVRTAVRPDAATLERLDEALRAVGFERLDDGRRQLAERIRTEIIRLVHRDDAPLRVNLSEYLSETLHHEYSVLSKLFSEETGTTVERCYIAQRIERVKELLSYGELSLSEIADRMNYSSVAHLSAQFKQVTGLTPSRYRQLAQPPPRPPDKL